METLKNNVLATDKDDKPFQKRTLEKLVEAQNICELLEDDELAVISKKVLDELGMDESDETRKKKLEKWRIGASMANQDIIVKDTPWEGASSFQYPLISNACIQFWARAYVAIVTPSGVVKKKVIGEEKRQQQQQAKQLQDEMKAQMTGQPPPPPPQAPMPQQPPQMPGLMQLAGMQGQFMAPERTKDEKASNSIAYMNYQYMTEMKEWRTDTSRLLMQLPGYGRMYRKYWQSKIKRRPCTKILTPLELITPAKISSLYESPRISELFTLTSNEIESNIRSGDFIEFAYQVGNSEDSEYQHEFVEQHRLLDLDKDGFKEPYICTVHRDTQTTCAIKANFKMDGITRTEDKNKVIDIKKRDYYVPYEFIPSMDGTIYSCGFYDLLAPLNDGVNTNINQLVDAGKLANTGGGFISKDLRMNKEPMNFATGKYIAVNARGDDIRKGLVPMQWPGPNPVLFTLMEFLLGAGREISNTQNILENAQKSQMPATTTVALVEQGGKVPNGIYKGIHQSLYEEFQLLKKLNAEYLPTEEYRKILDINVNADDFKDESFDYEPVSDPEEVSDIQRMAKAEFLMGMMGNPIINPVEATKRILTAANIPDVDSLIVPPQPPPPDPRAQIEQMKLQLEEMKLDQKRESEAAKHQIEQMKLQIQAQETESKIVKNRTSAIKDIADAEAVEAGTQLDYYNLQMQGLEYDRNHENTRRGQDITLRKQDMDAAQAEQARSDEQAARRMAESSGNAAV